MGSSVIAARAFVDGRRILYAAPTQEQTDAFWNYCKEYFAHQVDAGHVYKNESRRILEGQGRIRAKTAWNADTLRGDFADLLILEEYAMMDPSAWDKIGAPMLLDNNGDAVFISTPRRRNHFHKRYTQAVSDDSGRWGVWHFTSHDNPYLSEEALAEITADMTQDAYRQEVMAEFLENEGQVFRNIAEHTQAPANEHPNQHKGHRIVGGTDWGDADDYTVLPLGCADCRQELVLYRNRHAGYRHHKRRIAALDERWNPAVIKAELNSVGRPNVEDLRAEGIPVEGFKMTSDSKQEVIESLVLAFEKPHEDGGWQFLPNDAATAELEAFERTTTRTGRPRYGAPEGMHDDTVIARALMVYASQQSIGDFVW